MGDIRNISGIPTYLSNAGGAKPSRTPSVPAKNRRVAPTTEEEKSDDTKRRGADKGPGVFGRTKSTAAEEWGAKNRRSQIGSARENRRASAESSGNMSMPDGAMG